MGILGGTLGRQSVAHQIAERLRDYILSRGFAPGQRLPTEQELCRVFGVSRVAVREALKMLEGQGLVVTRPGPRGGARVARPSPGKLAEAFTAICELGRVPPAQLLQVRLPLERMAVRCAATRATAEDVRSLLAIVEEMRRPSVSVAEFNELDVAFHTRIAEASKNEALALVMHAVRHAISTAIDEAYRRLPDPQEVNRRLAVEHQAILECIARHDPGGAEALMVAHVRGFYREALGLELEGPCQQALALEVDASDVGGARPRA